jgi:hypothetical protein
MTYARGAIGNNFSEGEGLYISEKLIVNAATKLGSVSATSLTVSGAITANSMITANAPDGTIAIKAYSQINVERSSASSVAIWVERGGVTINNGALNVSGETHLSDKIFLANDKGLRVNGDNGAVTYSTSVGYLVFGNGNTITYIQGKQTMITSSSGNDTTISSGRNTIISPASGGNVDLRGTVLVNGSPISTSSDKRQKNDIKPLAEKYLSMMKSIDPVSFKYNSDLGKSGRRHTGFIAQDVLQSMTAAGIDTSELAAFVDVKGDGSEYALRYEEFISPLLAYVQHLEGRVAALERTG